MQFKDVADNQEAARKDYEAHIKKEKLATSWDNLDQWGRLLLTEISFNVGKGITTKHFLIFLLHLSLESTTAHSMAIYIDLISLQKLQNSLI